MSKNKKLVESFTRFCEKHPEMRFWQALLEWSGLPYILSSSKPPEPGSGQGDTFYWEGKTE